MIFDSNLMFISKDFPGTAISFVYNLTGNFFTLTMIVIQATIPFYMVYLIRLIACKLNKKNALNVK